MIEIHARIDILQKLAGNLEVPEIRVWCHPERIGEKGKDYYEVFDTFQEAMAFAEINVEAEDDPLIAFKGYELNIFRIDEAEGEGNNVLVFCPECAKKNMMFREEIERDSKNESKEGDKGTIENSKGN